MDVSQDCESAKQTRNFPSDMAINKVKAQVTDGEINSVEVIKVIFGEVNNPECHTIGVDEQTGRMTSGDFEGKNVAGKSGWGSANFGEMAQSWVDDYGDMVYTTDKMKQKQARIKNRQEITKYNNKRMLRQLLMHLKHLFELNLQLIAADLVNRWLAIRYG